MEYDLIDAGPCRKKVILKFTAQDIAAAFDESYQEINGQVQLKGFRKGKAPRRALEKRFKNEAANEAKRFLTEKNLGEVIKKEDLKIIGDIVDKNRGEIPTLDRDFRIEIEMDVAPSFELPEYKGLELADQPVEVKDEAVEQSLERYRKMFANYAPVEGPAEIGDVLKVDFSAKIDGVEVVSMKEQRLRVEGEILFDLPCPELVEKFKGVKVGEVVTLGISMPADHRNVDLRGKPAQVEVAVNGVERGELPELSDAFAASLGMGAMADFRERIKANLVREAMLAARNKQEEEILDKLLGAVPFEVPLDMVENETKALLEQRDSRLSRGGLQEEERKAQVETYRPEAARLALRKVRWGIMAGKIGEKENITVSNEDMAAQVEALAQSYQTTPAKIIQRIREFDGAGAMMAEILSIKVVQFLIDHAKGGRLDPARKDTDTGSTNAAAAESVVKAETECGGEEEQGHQHGEDCGCGH